VDATTAAALLGHRRDAAVGLQRFGGGETFPLRTQAGQQARAQHRAGPGQAGEDRAVGVCLVSLGDLFIKLGDGLLHQLQFPRQQLHAQDEALDDGALVGDSHGLLDQLQVMGLMG